MWIGHVSTDRRAEAEQLSESLAPSIKGDCGGKSKTRIRNLFVEPILTWRDAEHANFRVMCSLWCVVQTIHLTSHWTT